MKTKKNESYILISSDEKLFEEFYTSFLKVEKEFLKEHLLLQISDTIKISKEEFSLFLPIAEQKKQDGISFVIINSSIDIDEVSEMITVVPTLQEAEDILEMEAIERELGF